MEGAIQTIFWLPSLQTERSRNFVETYKKDYGGEDPNNHAHSQWESATCSPKPWGLSKSSETEAARDALKTIKYEVLWASSSSTITTRQSCRSSCWRSSRVTSIPR